MSTSWIGGDIAGLSAMSQAMQTGSAAYSQELSQLDTHVAATAHGGVWDGQGGEQMRAAWTSARPVAGKPGELAAQTSGIIGELSDKLTGLESKLYNHAEAYSRQGVEIDGTGRPKALIISGMGSIPHAAQARAEATAAYARDRSSILEQAQQHRDEAAAKLSKLTGTPLQEKPSGEVPVNALIGAHEGMWDDLWDGAKCAGAIIFAIGSAVIPAAKILKIKKLIEGLGGVRKAVDLLFVAGTSEEKAAALGEAGELVKNLGMELLGITAVKVACGL
ncbi:MAG: hypothetical protein ACRC20_03705 [Segniliparus sp.]|uniref:hypothetical protein n=1 Tax=Segniliparus sp. TaxID=2804064 RepID=UPI003F353DCF